MSSENETTIRQESLKLVSTYFEAMKLMDLEAWSALWNEDAVVLIPLPEKGMNTEYRGLTDSIRPGMKVYFDLLKSYNYTIDAIHPSLDPEIVIVEWDMRAIVKRTGKAYAGKSITVFKMKNGKINEYQDYFNSAYFAIIAENT